MMVSHIAIAVFAVWAGIWSIILHVASIDLGWLFYVQGVLLTPAVVPIALTVLWRKQSKHAAFWGTMVGTTTGLGESRGLRPEKLITDVQLGGWVSGTEVASSSGI